MATGGVKIGFQDFPGHPLAKTLSSQCRVPGSIPGWGTKSYMPQLNTPHAVNKTWCNQRKKKKSILVGFLHVLCQAPTPTVAPPTPPPTTCLLSACAFPLQSFYLHPTPSPHTSPVCPATQVGAHRLSLCFKRLFMPPGRCSQSGSD